SSVFQLSAQLDRIKRHNHQSAACAADETKHGEDEQSSGAGGPGSRSEESTLAAHHEPEAETGARTEWRGGVLWRCADSDRAPFPEPGRSLPGVLEGEGLRAEETGAAHSTGGACTDCGYGL